MYVVEVSHYISSSFSKSHASIVQLSGDVAIDGVHLELQLE